MNKIDPKDISVVVQGPVFGAPSDDYTERITFRALESISKSFPGSEIVLSTWEGSDVQGLPYDVCVKSRDPGILDIKISGLCKNLNRQIVSSKQGLKQTSRKYVLKTRSDLIFEGNNLTSFWKLFPERSDHLKILNEKVICCTVQSQNPRKNPVPFSPSDWIHFGLKEDVLCIWDIPLLPGPMLVDPTRKDAIEGYRYLVGHQYSSEQFIWTSFLRKFVPIQFEYARDTSHNAIEISELSFANNLILLEPEQLQIKSLKYQFSDFDARILYTFSEWVALYYQYCVRGMPFRYAS